MLASFAAPQTSQTIAPWNTIALDTQREGASHHLAELGIRQWCYAQIEAVLHLNLLCLLLGHDSCTSQL